MCQLLNRGNLVTGAKVFTNGSGRDNWVSKMGVGLVKEQRAQGEGEGGFPWSSRWVCHLAL